MRDDTTAASCRCGHFVRDGTAWYAPRSICMPFHFGLLG